MNLCKKCPEIPDTWRGSITDVAKILGGEKPLSRKTVRKYIERGHSKGGIRASIAKNGRMRISGKEVKRLWALL